MLESEAIKLVSNYRHALQHFERGQLLSRNPDHLERARGEALECEEELLLRLLQFADLDSGKRRHEVREYTGIQVRPMDALTHDDDLCLITESCSGECFGQLQCEMCQSWHAHLFEGLCANCANFAHEVEALAEDEGM